MNIETLGEKLVEDLYNILSEKKQEIVREFLKTKVFPIAAKEHLNSHDYESFIRQFLVGNHFLNMQEFQKTANSSKSDYEEYIQKNNIQISNENLDKNTLKQKYTKQN